MGKDQENYIVGATLEHLGVNKVVADSILDQLARPGGLFLVTGDPSTRKHKVIKGLLLELTHQGKKIAYLAPHDRLSHHPGVRHVKLKPNIGFYASQAIKQAMHDDPEVIVIDSQIDQLSLPVAIRASLMGKTVIAAIDAQDGYSALEKIRQMVPDFMLSLALRSILALKPIRGTNGPLDLQQLISNHGDLDNPEVIDFLIDAKHKEKLGLLMAETLLVL